MGQSGVEPNDQHPAVNAMWLNRPNRITSARQLARNACTNGNHASAHSIMLSAYITALSGNPAEGRHPVKFFLLALWHALCMSRRIEELNHNQLDVWLQFILKLRSRLPIFKSSLNKVLIEGAAQAVNEASIYGKPHQRALAFMTHAEVVYVVEPDRQLIEAEINLALNHEKSISAEPDQPQALRQFVRILRKAGEMYAKPEFHCYRQYRVWSMLYLRKALELAKGKADCPDQIPKIEAVLRHR